MSSVFLSLRVIVMLPRRYFSMFSRRLFTLSTSYSPSMLIRRSYTSLPPTAPNSSWIGKAKEAVETNKELFIIFGGLISGVTVVCTFVIGNNWKLKNEIDVLKERQEKEFGILKERQETLKKKQEGLRNEFIAMLKGLRDVNNVYNTNWRAILNKDEVVIPKAAKRT
ncbi:hypothetical protein F8M41_008810 [Gigaspora margarita]|uniref:Uncharacterized protein n=1 Tax=Gigaspora margarita TaxID=4874 RepID=A0A8H3X352_GIGMA|nr:hypothetical protein F8M41_008810 [Gigaspora margarita]